VRTEDDRHCIVGGESLLEGVSRFRILTPFSVFLHEWRSQVPGLW